MLQEGVIALLSAVGLTTVLWCAADLVFRRRMPRSGALVVLPLWEDVSEYEVQSLLAQRRRMCGCLPVVLLDCGLSALENERAALLTQTYEGVILMSADEWSEYWKKTERKKPWESAAP